MKEHDVVKIKDFRYVEFVGPVYAGTLGAIISMNSSGWATVELQNCKIIDVRREDLEVVQYLKKV